MTSLAPHMEAFLREHLARHRGAERLRRAQRATDKKRASVVNEVTQGTLR